MALKVELSVFDGPLDLLLHLIEKNKINIFDIPIVEITDQYLAYVRQMETEDLGVMSEFMVMAAELIAIKCRMLLPPEVDEEGEEIDPRSDLVQQLLEYKMYKYMSYELRDRMNSAARSFYKKDTTPAEVLSYRPPVDTTELIGDLTLKQLHKIFDQVIRRQPDFVFALYNKANILCAQRDFKSAIDYYTRAIAQDIDFAEAYFNRGLTYIYIGENEKGLADLSKAGELGIYQAYNLITRFK